MADPGEGRRVVTRQSASAVSCVTNEEARTILLSDESKTTGCPMLAIDSIWGRMYWSADWPKGDLCQSISPSPDVELEHGPRHGVK